MRIEGQILGFDEYMNLVLDEAEEVRFGAVWFGIGSGMVWHGMVWFGGMVWRGTVWYGMAWQYVVLYGIWYSMVWCGVVLYGTV